MTSERWQKVKTLLNEVLDRPPDERAGFLKKRCPDDAALREEVQSLLAAYDDDDVFFSEGAFGEETFPPTEAPLDEGTVIGPYRLAEVLGRGGMGTVYRAARDDAQYEREVALKVIRPGLYTPEMRQRFQAERQILASLEHPHIARLYDGGLTDDGRPYFAMELVEGTPIDRYCNEQQLSISARLQLFEKVARALAYAHQKLVVHRDLKPSNVLVTPDGEPKLLDFGVAKLLDPEAIAGTLVTRTGRALMTPEYAAPEQVRGEEITAATDVYTLGMLLYELLAGRRPYRFEKRTPSHIEQVICEVRPTRPSTAATRPADEVGDAMGTPKDISRARSTQPGRLRRALKGDLDRIVLKALRKEPERRYGSAAELADDLRCHREGLPVKARPATWRYRASKFMRRNRWGVAAAAVLLLLLVGYAATVTVQAQRIARERDTAEAAMTFLVDLFHENNPLHTNNALTEVDTLNRSPGLREVFTRGAERVRTELNDQPVVQARLSSVIGQVYTDMGLYEKAAPLLRTAVRQQRSHLGDTHPNLALSLTRLGWLRYQQGSFKTAENRLREAIALYRQAGDDHTDGRVSALNNLAQVKGEQGHYSEAERLYRNVLSLRRRADLPESGSVLHNLAITLRAQGAFDEAIQRHEEAIQHFIEQYGAMHPAVANAKAMYAFTLQEKGDYAAAESLHTEALEARRKLLPEGHPHIASSLVRLSMVLVYRGRPSEAESLAREGYEILRARLPEDHWRVTAAKGVLGLCWAGQEQFQRAETPLVESFRAFRKDFGLDDWRTQEALQVLVQLYTLMEQPNKAAAYRDTLAASSDSTASR